MANVEFSIKEIECLMNYVEADESETVNGRLEFARYMLHHESRFEFPLRSVYAIRKMYYKECNRRKCTSLNGAHILKAS